MPNSTANVKARKPRPAPVRKPKRPTKKTLKGIESLASSAANNVVQRTLKEFQKIRNIAQYKGEGPAQETHSYGVLSDPSAREPSARKPRPKPVRRTKKQFNATTNPYSINMVMNNPVKISKVKISRVRKSVAKKPSSRKGFSLNQVTFPDTPHVPSQVPRIMTLDELVHSNVSLNQAKANAQRNAQLFVSAFAKRKSAAKPRKPKGKAI
jgi:hypothetical protein